jgi:hypothetical protein
MGRSGWSARSVVAFALFAQATNPSPRDLIKAARPLTAIEVAAVVRAAQRAIVGKTFRLSAVPGGAGSEFLMGPDGRPRIFRSSGGIVGGLVGGVACASPPCPASTPPVRTEWHDYVTTVLQFTGRPARRCSGEIEPGELVIEYEHSENANAWTASARAKPPPGLGIGYSPVFDIVRGATPLTSGELRKFGERTARAFFAPWTPPPQSVGVVEVTGDPLPNVPPIVNRIPRDETQTLWIDTESLRPIRWEAVGRDGGDYHFTFTYERIDLRPPDGVRAPDCVR